MRECIIHLKKEEIKMKETKEALWKNYKEITDRIECLGEQDERYGVLVEKREKVMSDIIKLEQIESENKREQNRNIATYVTLGVTTVSGLIVAFKSFRFDEDSTMTSTIGRTSVTNMVSRLFKR